MVIVERYGIPSTRIISAIQGCQFPFRAIEPEGRLLFVSDNAIDAMACQAPMIAARHKGCDPTLCIFSCSTHHCGELMAAALEAAHGADAFIALSTTALNSKFPHQRRSSQRAEAIGGRL